MPLPTNFAVKTATVSYEPLDEGVYEAVLQDLESPGVVDTPWGPKEQIILKFEIPSLERVLSHTISNVWSPGGKYPPSSLFVISQALGWNSREIPTTIQLNEMVGTPLLLVVKNKKNERGEIRSRITEFLPVNKKGGLSKKQTNKLIEDTAQAFPDNEGS